MSDHSRPSGSSSGRSAPRSALGGLARLGEVGEDDRGVGGPRQLTPARLGVAVEALALKGAEQHGRLGARAALVLDRVRQPDQRALGQEVGRRSGRRRRSAAKIDVLGPARRCVARARSPRASTGPRRGRGRPAARAPPPPGVAAVPTGQPLRRREPVARSSHIRSVAGDSRSGAPPPWREPARRGSLTRPADTTVGWGDGAGPLGGLELAGLQQPEADAALGRPERHADRAAISCAVSPRP